MARPTESPVSTLRFGVLGEPATLDPYSDQASDLTRELIRPVFRSLYRLGPDGVAVPDIASSTGAVRGAITIRLNDVPWSDGGRVRPSDVVQSMIAAKNSGALPAGIGRVEPHGNSVRVIPDPGFNSRDWPMLLSKVFVLPDGRFTESVASGPFTLASHVPGLKVVYKPNGSWPGEKPLLGRLVVTFVQSLDLIVGLLEQGRLDAAAPPSAVNLQERLRERDLNSNAALGDERIYLDLEGADLTADERRYVARAIDRSAIEKGLVRGDGTLDKWLAVGPAQRPGVELDLAAPVGDELLVLTQRVVQVQLKKIGLQVDLVTTEPRTFYSEWAVTDPFDMAVRRAIGDFAPADRQVAPGLIDEIPMFRVESVLAWRDGVHGLVPGPTSEGPLWNAEGWWVEAG